MVDLNHISAKFSYKLNRKVRLVTEHTFVGLIILIIL